MVNSNVAIKLKTVTEMDFIFVLKKKMGIVINKVVWGNIPLQFPLRDDQHISHCTGTRYCVCY